jgi:hypothetical protein
MKLLLCFTLIIIPFINFSQWNKTYGGTGFETGYSIDQTTDGGYIITGMTESYGNGSGDVWLLKLNSVGDTVWTKTIGESITEEGLTVRQTSDDGFIITARKGSIPFDTELIKTNNVGDTLWTQTFGAAESDILSGIQETDDNGFILSGWTQSFGNMNGQADSWLVKTNNIGDTLWTKTYGGLGWEQGKAIQTNDGGFLLTSVTHSFNNSGQAWLIKTNNVGDTLWTKLYGGFWNEYISNSIQTSDNGYALIGQTNSFGNGNNDVWFIKTDINGDTLWTKTYGGSDDDFGISIDQTNDGGYIISAGTNSSGNGLVDYWLIKTNALGDTLWTRTYGGSSNDYPGECYQTADGGYIMMGYTESFGNGDHDIWLIKTDANGIASNIELFISNNLTLYPNPVADILTIEGFESLKGIAKIEVVNLNGQIVHVNSDLSTSQLDVSGLSNGTYIISVYHKGGVEKVKFVKK